MANKPQEKRLQERRTTAGKYKESCPSDGEAEQRINCIILTKKEAESNKEQNKIERSQESSEKTINDDQEHQKRKRKAGRRSKTKDKSKTVEMKFIQTNCDGYTSKQESFDDIVKDENPDVMVINDTALKGNRKVKIPYYFSYNKNREKSKGGVATVIANYLKPNTVKVAEGKNDDEYIITRFDNTIPAINLINIYGEQEGNSSKDDIEKGWLRLEAEITEIETRNEAILIMGDLNKAIGNDDLGVKGNKKKTSKGGRLIRNFLKSRPYTVLNNLDSAKDGPWTWVDRQNNNIKSCLDLVIASDCLMPFVSLVWVDRERKFTPRRVLKSKKNSRTIFTDHFPVKVVLTGLPRRKEEKTIAETNWNLGKPGGWEVYKKLTDEAAGKVKEIVTRDNLDIEAKTKKIEAIEKKIKFSAFGKTKPSTKTAPDRTQCRQCRILPCTPSTERSQPGAGPPYEPSCEKCKTQKPSTKTAADRDQCSQCRLTRRNPSAERSSAGTGPLFVPACEKCKSQEQKDEDLVKRQGQRIANQIIKIKEMKQGRTGSIFKMRDQIEGHKKAKTEASAIRDPKTNELLVNKEEIKKATLKYVVENLKCNEPDDDVKEMVEARKMKQLNIMKDKSGETFQIDQDDFMKVLGKFGSKRTKTYDFLLKAGERYKDAMFLLCKRMIDDEEFPSSFRKTILHMIGKRSGLQCILKNNRFLHMKQVLCRSIDALVVDKMRPPLINSATIYQLGGLPGHSILEHLITLKMIMARVEDIGIGIIFLIVDIMSYFDKEDIYDCLETMETLKVNKKAARLWFKLNQDTEVAVKMPCGMTETAKVGDCLAQGTSSAGLVSQANLDHGLNRYFSGSKDVLCYGGIRIQPLSFQDDIGSPCSDVSMARVQSTFISSIFQEKTLEAHPDKTCYLILGSEKFKKEAQEEMDTCPIQFNKFTLQEKKADKYLGQVIKSNLSESALATVQQRSGKIKGATMQIKAIIEDFRMQALAGLMAARDLWEHALLPSLLSGAGTWLGNIKETEDFCDGLQDFFWRVILEIPESSPKIALRCEPKMIGMKWRIWEEKCLLLKQISRLEDRSLAKIMCHEAKENDWPGLNKEVKDICKEIKIKDIGKNEISKTEIQEAIFNSHYNDMKEQLKESKKLADIKNEDFRFVQPYFLDKSVANGRLAFRIRTKMVKKIPGNFKNQYKNNENGLKCRYCSESVMTQAHCISCPGLEEMRDGLELYNMEDLVIFFRRLLDDDEKKKK